MEGTNAKNYASPKSSRWRYRARSGAAQATTIPAVISSTLTITTNSKLTTDVSCTVTGAPCIRFGASGIVLNLNGHIITGNGGQTSCTHTSGEDGINTNGFNSVTIVGPGIVRRFNEDGIDVTGNNSTVKRVTILSNCDQGVTVTGNSNVILANSFDLNALAPAPPNNRFASIFLAPGSGSNTVQNNAVTGSFFGVFVGEPGSASTNNLITGNDFSGTVDAGIGIVIFSPSSGNAVSTNQALGNLGVDIFDINAAGTNTYTRNLCETALINGADATSTICKPVANISGHRAPLIPITENTGS